MKVDVSKMRAFLVITVRSYNQEKANIFNFPTKEEREKAFRKFVSEATDKFLTNNKIKFTPNQRAFFETDLILFLAGKENTIFQKFF
jgi:hypothetical protein